jgi:hypothetical protein
LEDAAFFWREGLKCIAENPLVLVKSLGDPIKLFLGNDIFPWAIAAFHPLQRLYNFLYLILIYPGICLGFIRGLTRKLSRRTRLGIALSWAGILPFFIFLEAEIRFRVPFDVILIPLSIWGWSGIVRSLKIPPKLLREPVAVYWWILLFVPWSTHYFLKRSLVDFEALWKTYPVIGAAFLMLVAHLLIELRKYFPTRAGNRPAVVAPQPA